MSTRDHVLWCLASHLMRVQSWSSWYHVPKFSANILYSCTVKSNLLSYLGSCVRGAEGHGTTLLDSQVLHACSRKVVVAIHTGASRRHPAHTRATADIEDQYNKINIQHGPAAPPPPRVQLRTAIARAARSSVRAELGHKPGAVQGGRSAKRPADSGGRRGAGVPRAHACTIGCGVGLGVAINWLECWSLPHDATHACNV